MNSYRSPSPPTAARFTAAATPVFDNRYIHHKNSNSSNKKTLVLSSPPSSSSSPVQSSTSSSSSPSTPLSGNYVTSPLSSPDDGAAGTAGLAIAGTKTKKMSLAREEKTRTTNIQVCVRMRPILPSDATAAAAAAARANGSSKDGLPPTPELKMKNSFSSRKSNISKESSRLSSVSQETQDSAYVVDTEPAWEVQGNTFSQAEHTNPEKNRRNSYTFDHTFGPMDNNRDLYNSTVRDTVISTMEGYHASVFAYGQTATGKTFTMTGKRGGGGGSIKNGEGIIQLAIRDCFDYLHNQKDEDTREYLLRVSFMEIYNEVIHDLLASPVKSQPMMMTSPTANASSSLHNDPTASSSIRIFESKNEGVIIRGLKEEIVTCPEQVFALLAAGERRRHTGSTGMNKHSSRSHSIFRLTVESRRRIPRQNSGIAGGGGSSKRWETQTTADSIASSTFAPASTVGPVRVSTLSLVDLAGSESVRNTGSAKARLKEGQYINKSLLTLGHVVYKLAEASSKRESNGGGGGSNGLDNLHIPYRDSKLTRLLQPSLSGNAQICIICNISPLSRHIEESHLTLKFASRAKKIKQHATITEVVDEKTLLENYREEIEELKNQLKEARDSRGNAKNPTSSPIDDDDVQVLSQAVSNLERLILKTTTAEEKRRRKKRREALLKLREEQEHPITINGDSSLKSNGGDTLLNGILNKNDDDTMLDALSLDDNSLTMSHREAEKMSASIKDDHSLGGNSVGDESTVAEGRNLISELHRIQGLLGGVLAKKGSVGSLEVKKVASSPSTVNAQSDVEVERLRAQLHEQSVSSSLRMADQTFLQAQLQEKDLLLKDISQILEAVEKRQVDLETENERLKMRLQNTSSELRTKESETFILEKLITKRDDEIKKLKAQLRQ